jgi:hypothetical protein
MLIGLSSSDAIGRFALGADVVEAVSRGALSVRLAKWRERKGGLAFAEPFIEVVGYAGANPGLQHYEPFISCPITPEFP